MLTTFSVWLTAVALYIIRNNFEWRFSIRILFLNDCSQHYLRDFLDTG